MNALIFLSAADPRPMYQQIVDQISGRVLAGEWAPGELLPSIRELAATSGVSVITVKRAYEELERAGLIQTRQGKGSMVADHADQARALHQQALTAQLTEVATTASRLGLDRAVLHAQLDAALDTLLPPTTGHTP